jgi:hypothetical protein
MWLRFGGLEGVSGAPQRRILPDDFSVFQASVDQCTREGNRIVFPVSFSRPVSLSIRQSRVSDFLVQLSESRPE